MKYMLLINQGDAPTPRDPDAWSRLSEDEQKAVYSDYQAINETPGVTPGLQLDSPETATTVRVADGRTLTTDGPFVAVKEALGGWLVVRGRRPRRRDRAGGTHSGSPPRRCGGGAPGRGLLSCAARAGLP